MTPFFVRYIKIDGFDKTLSEGDKAVIIALRNGFECLFFDESKCHFIPYQSDIGG